jgi:hypothetical protein
MDLLGQDFQQDGMIQTVKAGFDVSFKEPRRPKPGALYLL